MKRSGSLYKRGETYWLRYVIEGCAFCVSMKTKIRLVAEGNRDVFMRDRCKGLDQYRSYLESELTRIKKFRGELVAGSIKLDDAYDAFYCSPKRTTTSLDMYLTAWINFIAFMPSGACLTDVTSIDAAQHICRLEDQGITNGTAKKHVMAIRTIFRTLLPSDIENPFEDVVARGDREVFSYEPVTLEQCKALIDQVDSMYTIGMYKLLLIMMYTGLRLSDAAGITAGNIDFERGVITVTPSKTIRYNKKAVIGLHPVLRDVLYNSNTHYQGFIMPILATWSRDKLSTAVQKVFKDAGVVKLKERASGRKQNVYGASSFRHLFQDRMRLAGVNQNITNLMLCHSDKGSMSSTYSTITDEELAAAVNKALPDIRG